MTEEVMLQTLKAILIEREIKVPSDVVLKYEIDCAIGAINECRRFSPTSTKKYDSKYEHLIIPLVVSSLAKIGGEGETQHTEQNITRTFKTDGNYPVDILNKITPLVK